MRFIVALLIASLFVDKADSELSFIPRHNLPASYSPRVRSQKDSYHPPTYSPHSIHEPIIILIRERGEPVKIEKSHWFSRDNQARTDDFHHVKVTLYH